MGIGVMLWALLLCTLRTDVHVQAQPSPAPAPLTGMCAHTPPEVCEGATCVKRVPSDNYVFFPRVGIAGHDLAWGPTALWGGVDGLRSWCDHNATCIGYAVDTSDNPPQVWFKAAAGLDYHGKGACPWDPSNPSAAPADKWVPDWGLCPYGGHDGPVTWTSGGLYIKCANKTQTGFHCTGAAGLYQCVPSSNSTGGNSTFGNQQQCLEQCKAPPSPPPGPPPPAPHYDKPYLRFGMVIPMPQIVDCTVTQGSITHTWKSYGFGKFSDWITTFAAAPATVTIATGGSTILTKVILL